MDAYTLTVYGVDSPAQLWQVLGSIGAQYSRFVRIRSLRGQSGVTLVALIPKDLDPATFPCHRWASVLHPNKRGTGTLEGG